VLRALSASHNGRSSVVVLAERTKIHRTTVKRLLETLRRAGMVRFIEDQNEYCLAFNVLQLADGFRQSSWISEIARPQMEALTRLVMWPSDLMAPDDGEMLVCESTHALTPWSFNSGVIGTRVPLLHSAGGRAYLAWCSDEERERLLQLLRANGGGEAAFARDTEYVKRLLRQTRRNGYGLSERREDVNLKNAAEFNSARCDAIAVPILRDGSAIASINLVFLARATSTEDVVRRHLPELRGAAERISEALEGEKRRRTSGLTS
jgi:IclR family mhp operon transcriptional activator